MFHLIAENPVRFILALGIGIATAWWIWGRLGRGRTFAEETAVRAEPVQSAQSEPMLAPAPMAAPASERTTSPARAPEPLTIAEVEQADLKPKIAAAVGEADDLALIKGIGPKLKALCYSIGVKRFDQIAAWDESDIAEVDSYLKTFRARIVRDQWIEQARLLADGKDETHRRQFG